MICPVPLFDSLFLGRFLSPPPEKSKFNPFSCLVFPLLSGVEAQYAHTAIHCATIQGWVDLSHIHVCKSVYVHSQKKMDLAYTQQKNPQKCLTKKAEETQLKGAWHEIFDFRFFSWTSVPQAPKYSIGAVLNFFENSQRYSRMIIVDTGD